MATKAGKERNASIVLALIATFGLLLPLVIGVMAWATADATLRIGDAGTFVSSHASGGGLFTPMSTTVQTSIGSIVVSGALSAMRGQNLLMEDRLKSGLQLCVQTKPKTCAHVSGPWTGKTYPIRHPSHAVAWMPARLGVNDAAFWFLLGLLATLTAFFVQTDANKDSKIRGSGTPAEQAD